MLHNLECSRTTEPKECPAPKRPESPFSHGQGLELYADNKLPDRLKKLPQFFTTYIGIICFGFFNELLRCVWLQYMTG